MKFVNWSKFLSCIMALVMMMMCTVPAFAVEMSDEVCASSTSNDFNETIHMTDEQALE